jgi:transaldolase
MNPAQQVAALGQSLWLDNLSRDLLRSGALKRMIDEDGVSGVTSNPTIFHKALTTSPHYAADLARLRAEEPDPERRYEALILADVRDACDLLRPLFERSAGDDGYVSLEVAPRWAYDTTRTVQEAHRLWSLVNRKNLLVKVPGTPEGVAAFEALTQLGINVNVTLLFSVSQVQAVFDAYIRGLSLCEASGSDLHRHKAVASLFLSRVDTMVDSQLADIGHREALSLRGKAAVAIAKAARRAYRRTFEGEAFADLARRGARAQYLLWASTGAKNPDYHDLLYVEPLIGAETVNTMPDKTLAALREHGHAALCLEEGVAEAEAQLADLERLGVDMEAVGNALQRAGVDLFEASYQKVLQDMA